MFSVRIVTTDHYQATPIQGLDVQHSEFRNAAVYKVPVIRVYGSTPAGQKTCMHVHGVFPYLYVPYDGTQPWDRYMRLFAASLDKAINVAQGHSSSNVQHVYKVVLVSGIPMYGYHPKEQQFLKVYFYNPGIVRKAADLLLGGAVLNKGFQPHESHIPYTLQMFIDYNLYGMNMINLAALKFRRKNQDDKGNPMDIANQDKSDDNTVSPQTPVMSLTDIIDTSVLKSPSTTQTWDEENIPSDMYMGSDVVRQSVCELEVDVVAADILNRLEVDANIGTNPGLAALWEDERQRRRDRGESSQIEPPQSQERTEVIISDSDRELSEKFREIALNLRLFSDSQSDTASEDSQEEMIATQSASMIDMHLSQSPDEMEGSQDTVMLEGDEEEEEEEHQAPIVSIDSIKRIVSMSQSFSNTPPSQHDENADRSLAQILASLADESSPPASQAAANEVTILEEKDSIMREEPVVPDDEAVANDDNETLEMSQVVWDDGSQENQMENPEYDLAGLDTTWNESQLPAPESEGQEEEELTIPQFDGANDEKPKTAAKKPRKKRLGTNGPVSTFDQMVEEARKHGVNVNSIPGMYGNPRSGFPGINQDFNYPSHPQMQQPGLSQQGFGNYGDGSHGNMQWSGTQPNPYQMPGFRSPWPQGQNFSRPWMDTQSSSNQGPQGQQPCDSRGSTGNVHSGPGVISPQGQLNDMRSPSGGVSPQGQLNNMRSPPGVSPQGQPNDMRSAASAMSPPVQPNNMRSPGHPNDLRSPMGQRSPQGNITSPPGLQSSQGTVTSPNDSNSLGLTPPQSFPASCERFPSMFNYQTSPFQNNISPQGMCSPIGNMTPSNRAKELNLSNRMSAGVQNQRVNLSSTSSAENISGMTSPQGNLSSQFTNASYERISPVAAIGSDGSLSSPHGSRTSSHGSIASPHSTVQSPSGQPKGQGQMGFYGSQMSNDDAQMTSPSSQFSPMESRNSQWTFSQMNASYDDQSRGMTDGQYSGQSAGFLGQYSHGYSLSQQETMSHMQTQPSFSSQGFQNSQMQQQYSSQQVTTMREEQSNYQQGLDLSQRRSTALNQESAYPVNSNSAHIDKEMSAQRPTSLGSSQGVNFSQHGGLSQTQPLASPSSSQSFGPNLSQRSNVESVTALPGVSANSNITRRNSDSFIAQTNQLNACGENRSKQMCSSMPEKGPSSNISSPSDLPGLPTSTSSWINSLKEAFTFAGNRLREVSSSQHSNVPASQVPRPQDCLAGNGQGGMGPENGALSQNGSMNSTVYQGQSNSTSMQQNQNFDNYGGSLSQFKNDHYGQMCAQRGQMPPAAYSQGRPSYYDGMQNQNFQQPHSGNFQMQNNGAYSGGYYPQPYGQGGSVNQGPGNSGNMNQPVGGDGKVKKPRKPRKPREKKVKTPEVKVNTPEVKVVSALQGSMTHSLSGNDNVVNHDSAKVIMAKKAQGSNLLEKLLLAPDEEDSDCHSMPKDNSFTCSETSNGSQNSNKQNVPISFSHKPNTPSLSSTTSSLSSTSPGVENNSKELFSDHSKANCSNQSAHTSSVFDSSPDVFKSNTALGNLPSEQNSLKMQVEKKRRGRPPKVRHNPTCISSLQNFVSSHKTQYGEKVKKIATGGKPYGASLQNMSAGSYNVDSSATHASDTRNTQNAPFTEQPQRDPMVYLPDDDNLSPTYTSLDDSFNAGSRATSVEELIKQRSQEFSSCVDPECRTLHRYSTDLNSSHPAESKVMKSTTRAPLVRSFSMPMTVKKKRGRPPKNPELYAAKARMRALSAFSENSDLDDFKITKPKKVRKKKSIGNKYTFVFQIPQYNFRKLKFIDTGRIKKDRDLDFVRMHPMDPRRYSLLKVGREIVRIPKLSKQHIAMGKMGQTEDLQELLKMSGVDVSVKRKSSMLGHEDETNLLLKKVEEEKCLKVAKSFSPERLIVQEKQRLSEIFPESNCYNIEKVALSSIIDHCLKTNIGLETSDDDPVVNKNPSFESVDTNQKIVEDASVVSQSSAEMNSLTKENPKQEERNMALSNVGSGAMCRTIEELMEKKMKEDRPMSSNEGRDSHPLGQNCANLTLLKEPQTSSYAPPNVGKPENLNPDSYLHVSQNSLKNKDVSESLSQGTPNTKVRKERKLSIRSLRKQNRLKLHKKLPLVIDPDGEEQDDPILHDVSLLEASDGRLTPLRSRTPIAGRSPIRQNYGTDQYQLVGADILCSKEDLDHNSSPDMASVSSKTESQSRSSSRTNSESETKQNELSCMDEPDALVQNGKSKSEKDAAKNLSDSELNNSDKSVQRNTDSVKITKLPTRSAPSVKDNQTGGKEIAEIPEKLVSKEQDTVVTKPTHEALGRLKTRSRSRSPDVGKRCHSEEPQCYTKSRSRTSSISSTSSRSLDFMGSFSENDCRKLSKRKGHGKRGKPVPGVDFIVTGKFKGYKKMEVKLQKLHITEQSVIKVDENSSDVQTLTKPICENLLRNFGRIEQSATCNDDSSMDSLYGGKKRSKLALTRKQNLHHGGMEMSSSDDSNSLMEISRKCGMSNGVHGTDGDDTEVLLENLDDIIDSNSDLDSRSGGGGKNLCMKKKKRLTKNQRLHMAFNSSSYKSRRKKSPVHSGKLMANLSLLHQATLANLNENVETYGDGTDDYKTEYEDAMYKMAMLSPHNSEVGEMSPPQPLSPGEVSGDICASTRSTSEVLSPVISTTTNSSPLSNASVSDMSPVYPPTAGNYHRNFSLMVDESPMKSTSQGVSPDKVHLPAKRKILETSEEIPTSQDGSAVLDSANEHSVTSKIVDDRYLVENSARSTDDKKDLSNIVSNESDSDDVIQPSPEASEPSAKSKYSAKKNFTSVRKSISSTSHSDILSKDDGNCSSPRKKRLGPLHTTRRAVVKIKPLSARDIEKYTRRGAESRSRSCQSEEKEISCRDRVIATRSSCDDGDVQMGLENDASECGRSVVMSTSQSNKEGGDKSGDGETPDKSTALGSSNSRKQDLPGSDGSKDTSPNGSPNQGNKKTGLVLSRGNQRLVYMPSRPPPSRESVKDSAVSYGLGTADNKEAFFSNPDDALERSREVGGRVLCVQSGRVKDLPEFEHSIHCTGLTTVRKILASNDQILGSQSENDSIFERLARDLDFKYALLGDKSVTIAPVKPPPQRRTVQVWLQNRNLYQDLKLKINGNYVADIEKKLDKVVEAKDNLKKNGDSDSNGDAALKIIHLEKSYMKHTNGDSNGKMKTVKSEPTRELSFAGSVETFSLTQTLSESDVDKVERGKVGKKEQPTSPELSGQPIDSMDDDIISPSPPRSHAKGTVKEKTCFSETLAKRIRLSQGDHSQSPVLSVTSIDNSQGESHVHNVSSTPKSSIVGLHSTPLRIKRLDKLFQASFTPIVKEGEGECRDYVREPGSDGTTKGKEPGFLTPKKIPLPKRLSINTVNRRLVPSGQNYLTPANQKDVSQIDGPTPKNSFGFKVSQQNLQEAKALHEVQHLTVLSLELHAETRRDLRPDPEVDAIVALFYSIHHDVKDDSPQKVQGVILVDPKSAQGQMTRRHREAGSSPQSSGSKVIHSSPQPSTSRARSPQPSTSKASPSASSRSRTKGTPDQKGKRSKRRSPSPRPAKAMKPLKDTDYIDDALLEKSGVNGDLQVTYVENEGELFEEFLKLVSRWDPDILVGFEIQNFSWGYLLQRASHLSINLCAGISRIPDERRKSSFKAESDEWGADHSSEIHIAGRVILNLWRLLRHEVALNIYSYENIAFHVLHERVPHFSFQTLNSWFNHRTHLHRWRFIQYYMSRVEGNMRIIDQLDLIGRTSEFARVFGIEFYHVLSRGSQYRVESMMLRLAKPMNFIPVSPSVNQRARMKAPECIPLTLEPESRFYADPVVVLDFQSLYPSIMIAHNYCFSTCVGRLDFIEKAHEGPIEFGCTHLKIPPSMLNKIKDDITVSPNGVVFVKQHIKKGIISAMVEEILNTRIMVKKSMKDYKKDKGLSRLLDARQLGLKLIANVTYGYTGANFSGRMPCIEVGDSIVRKARETLERAIKLVEDTPRWGARVVYGDTDSLFIELKGRSKEEAFNIGYEICDAVTAMNPKPIKLKFEKVYLPCVLQTKKRYVGYSYETPDQKEPIFDAKGIETVRRDSCSAVSKILERTIKILFTSRDVSQVKEYILKQCKKLMQGKVSMQDCIFAKEYRGMKGYKPGACVPALEIAKKLLRHDRRSEPRVGERVPYVIVYGSPGLPLIQLVRQPHEILEDPSLRINATYYITKQILPPLDRMFSLLGVDVFSWYNDMPKIVRIVPQSVVAPEKKKGTISQFFATTNCPVCDKQTNQAICNNCMENPQIVCVSLCDRIRKWEKVYQELVQVCNTCMGMQDDKQPCDSLDCPIMFRRVLAKQDVQKGSQLRETLQKAMDF